MATSRSTMSAGARPIHPAIIGAAFSADATLRRVERVAVLLAKLMQEIHGDEWKVDICHEYETEMIIIVPRPGRRQKKQATPKPEIV